MPTLSLHSPVGDLTIAEDDGAIVALEWGWGSQQEPTPLLKHTKQILEDYFDGKPIADDLPLRPAGTPYRQRVWQALREIPPGQTRTYKNIAEVAGGAARSVGQANAHNKIPILIPCHRVIATSHFGGYSGGDGLATKRALLKIEGLSF